MLLVPTYKCEKEKLKCPKGILPSGRPLHAKVGDGGWMEKLAPGLGWVSGESWSIPRAHVGLRLVWETLGRCFPRDDRRVFRYVFLTAQTRGHLFVPTRIFCEVGAVDS